MIDKHEVLLHQVGDILGKEDKEALHKAAKDRIQVAAKQAEFLNDILEKTSKDAVEKVKEDDPAKKVLEKSKDSIEEFKDKVDEINEKACDGKKNKNCLGNGTCVVM